MTAGRREAAAADARAIATLLLGGTYAQAAEAAGYSERTVRRHRDNDPEFRRQLEAGYTEALDRIRFSLGSAAATGVRVLLQAATSDTAPWPSRVAAAKALVELTLGTSIRLSGPDGGPVVIEAVTSQDDLIARLERLAPTPILDAKAIESGNGHNSP